MQDISHRVGFTSVCGLPVRWLKYNQQRSRCGWHIPKRHSHGNSQWCWMQCWVERMSSSQAVLVRQECVWGENVSFGRGCICFICHIVSSKYLPGLHNPGGSKSRFPITVAYTVWGCIAFLHYMLKADVSLLLFRCRGEEICLTSVLAEYFLQTGNISIHHLPYKLFSCNRKLQMGRENISM